MTRKDSQVLLYRRKLLATCGVAVCTAGCADIDGTNDDAPTEDTGRNESSEDSEGIITDISVPRTTPSNEGTTVDATVHNPGDERVSQTVSLNVEGETIDTEQIDLGGGEETVVDLLIPEDTMFEGGYAVSVTTSDDRDQSTIYAENPNPYGKETLVVAIEQETNARHDMHEIVRDALAYWEGYSEEFAGYPIEYDYVPNESEPDVLIRLVEEINTCGGHTGDIAGCAPLVRDQAPEPAEIRIVDGYREEWMTTTLKHELGHTLGLDHGDEPAHIMSDEIEDRVPEYTEREDALAAYSNSFRPYSNGMQSWNSAMAAWERGDYETTERDAVNAGEDFADADEQISDGKTIAGDLNEADAEELFSESQMRIEALRNAVDECVEMVQEASATFGDPEPHRQAVNSYVEESESYTYHEPEDLMHAFGFPSRS